ncbi:MAG: diaminopimelate decarboxylase [Actinomycetota bacterium]|nr:diaminopimelate decarboxylase [Actinomycetota bacterium]
MTEDAPAASEAPLARHLLPDHAAISSDGRLTLAGLDVVELAERFGTPLFIYDEDHLRRRCAEAVAAFPDGVAYATKAFLCKAMAGIALEAGMDLDVSTAGECAVALAAGAPADRLILHGNNKSIEELELAGAAVPGRYKRIVVDSFDEIARLAALAPHPLGPRPVLVRVTPGVEAHTHEYVMTGQEDTKFGFSIASGAADAAVGALAELEGVTLEGVHAHIGSQIFRLDGYERAMAVLARFVARHRLAELCVGGGLGVAYLNGEHTPRLGEWAAHLRAAAAACGLPEGVRLTAEPGRAIVASAAITAYRVGTMKALPGIRNYVAVDGGMSDNPRPVLYGSGYEAFLPRAADAERPYRARVVGKHCESGDVLVADARLPDSTRVGDILATPVTGAYGHSMASNYNRLGRPPVVFVRAGSARVVVRRETAEDLLALEP